MNTWTKAFIICLGLLVIASRADDTKNSSFSQARFSLASETYKK